jgi:hypothetical protein
MKGALADVEPRSLAGPAGRPPRVGFVVRAFRNVITAAPIKKHAARVGGVF